jgi:hypothetical protein
MQKILADLSKLSSRASALCESRDHALEFELSSRAKVRSAGVEGSRF